MGVTCGFRCLAIESKDRWTAADLLANDAFLIGEETLRASDPSAAALVMSKKAPVALASPPSEAGTGWKENLPTQGGQNNAMMATTFDHSLGESQLSVASTISIPSRVAAGP